MSRLVARILLVIFMLPAAALVYMLVIVGLERSWHNDSLLFVFCGVVTWAFIAGYWTLLWKDVVRLSATRISQTLLATMGAAAAGLVAGMFVMSIERDFGVFFGSVVAPVVWLIAVTLLWRKSAEERTERLKSIDTDAVVCPKCGYNLTGLKGTRCPECGTEYTLNELLAGQPSRAEGHVDE